MAAISSFTYTQIKRRIIDASISLWQSKYRLQAGDGSTLTYPTGGIPVSSVLLGLPNTIESLEMSDSFSPDGYLYKFNQTTQKIQIFGQNSTTGALVEIANTVTPLVDFNVIGEGY